MKIPHDAAALRVLLTDSAELTLFSGEVPTVLALRLYAENALDADEAARVNAALAAPHQARRLGRIMEDAAALEAAILRELVGRRAPDAQEFVVALRSRATPMKHLCHPRELSIAASTLPGGTIQTSDREDLVTLKVAERFDSKEEEGEIDVEVCTFDDPRLVDVPARLEVVADGKVVREYRFMLRARRFEGRFGIRRLPYTSDTVEFHLYLSIAL